MSSRQTGPYDILARKWLDLTERRRAHLIDLRASGRWKHYCTEAELEDQLRETNAAIERWAEVAGITSAIASLAADRGA